MASEQVNAMARGIRLQAPRYRTLKEAAEAFRRDFEVGIGEPMSERQVAALEEAFLLVKREVNDQVEILRRSSMFDPKPDWYAGPTLTDRHWPALSAYLVNAKGWSEETVQYTIGESSTEIVSMLGNPALNEFSCRGLVIGHVQSGKTANMTAVIAKALDAGYNTIIILAGLTNKLRQQTQRRLESDVADRHRPLWQMLTTAEDKGDFKGLANGAFFVPDGASAQMAVVKKNVAPLKRLIETIARTPPSVLRRMRILVIDDEADQASVNSSSNEFDMTRINQLIRRLLHALPAASYVGYTATPFANVFISPYDRKGNLDDLYPKDFITALRRPDGYFGTEQLFGREPEDPENPTPEEEGFDLIRKIPNEDIALLQPVKRDEKDAFQPKLVPSLEAAVLYFLACCAARRVRGQEGQHMSMLIHTSSFVIMHEKLADLIDAWLKKNRAALLTADSPVRTRMRSVWDEEANRLPDDVTIEEPVTFDELAGRLEEVLAVLEVPIENGVSEDRIDYEGAPKTYIVVGGSVLARGLTIEGLMVSYFLRSSSQYDTLLQMGRWFGYRRGYEDLPRIWTTKELAASFRSLATIEQEIREDVAEYAERNVSPMEFAVRVRSIPGMAITTRAKMRHAVECDISYSGEHIQTIQFLEKDEGVTRANWQAAIDLLSTATEVGSRSRYADRILFEGVPKNLIIRFLRNYHVETSRSDMKSEFIRDYINREDKALESWNVAVVSSGNSGARMVDLGPVDQVGAVTRSKLKNTEAPANIKALMSRQDVMIDCPGTEFDGRSKWDELKELRRKVCGDRGLLLLYPIDRLSAPRKESDSREPLNAVGDQIGVGIVFPGSTTGAGGYFRVNLNPEDVGELDDLEAEISEMEDKGLVD